MSELNQEIIEQYLDGELTGEALLAFEQEMQANPQLSKEVSLHRTIRDEMRQSILHRQEEQEVSRALQELGQQYFKKEPGKVISTRRWWYIAAAAAVVLLFLLIRPLFTRSFDNEKLFALYIQDVQGLPEAQRGSDNDSLLITAARLYNHKEYANALPLLQAITARQSAGTEFRLAAGVCYLQTGSYDTAAKIFDTIAAGATVFKNRALWYKSLVLLKQNRLEECYAVLATLPADADNYKEAQKLMKKIGSAGKNKQ